MKYRSLVVTAMAAVLMVSACRRQEPPPPPPSGPTAEEIEAQRIADSIRAAEEAEQARLAAQREAEAREAAARRAMEEARNTITERIHFDYDMATIRPDAERVLRAKLGILRASPTLTLRIEGHCDERGSNEYNDALGNRRAQAVVDFFTASGIGAGRLAIVSFGEDRPLVNQSNENAWAQNRRAEFVITGGEVNPGRTP